MFVIEFILLFHKIGGENLKTILKNPLNHSETLDEACKFLTEGEVVAIPTETVYGLSANALNAQAVEKIFIAKGRPSDNPLIVHISSLSMMDELISNFPPSAEALIDEFWPGPLTIILPKSDIIPQIVSAGLDTIGIRFPEHEVARRLIEKCGFPLAAPSANTSGQPSSTTAMHVFSDMAGKIPMIVDGGDCLVGIESTVIDLTCDIPCILRPGGISFEEIREILPNVIIDDALMMQSDCTPRSPGMKYRHYAPIAPLKIVQGNTDNILQYIFKNSDDKTGIMCFNEYENCFNTGVIYPYGGEQNSVEQARKLFDALRYFDDKDVNKIYAFCPNSDGIGLAVMNRLLKAAGFNVIEV